MRILLTLTLLVVIGLVAVSTISATRVVDYKNTFHKVYASDGSTLEPVAAENRWWATYDDSFWNTPGVKDAKAIDDSVELTPLDVCPPFYTRERARLFLDSNGFISLQPFSMCGSFCTGFHRDYGWIGTYGFDGSGGGGDWPMISGYMYDLEPLTGQVRYASFSNYTIVELRNVRQFRRLPNTGAVNLQFVIATNGTFIVRVQSVLGGVFLYIPGQPPIPDTGLVFSPSQRVLASVMGKSNITSWLFEPVADPCQQYDGTNCNNCVATGAADSCVWCAATRSCTRDSAAGTVCASGSDTFSTVAQCNANNGVFQSDASLQQQVFYNVSLQDRAKFSVGSASCLEGLASFAARNTAVAQLETYKMRDNNNIPTTTTPTEAPASQKTLFPVKVTMPFNISFFDFPASGAANQSAIDSNKHKWNSNELFIYESGIVKVGSAHEFPLDCDSTRGYCAVTNFPPGVFAPFGSYNIGLDSVAGAAHMVQIPARAPASSPDTAHNSPFCDPFLAATNTADPSKCARAIAVEFEHIIFQEQYGRNRRDQRQEEIRINMTSRVYIDEVGNVGVFVGRVAAAEVPIGSCGPSDPDNGGTATLGGWVYPHPTVGVVRFGSWDFSTIAIPYQAVYDDSVFWFSPVRGCPSCNGNGGCDTTTNRCQCKTAYAGETCSVCASGHYGRFCDQCPTCQNGGTCDDGNEGSGACVCAGQWSGEFCEVDCGTAAAARCTDPACSLFGGICTCGKCACREAAGWYGEKGGCTLWRDPCDKHSLGGCKECESNSGVKLSDGSTLENQCFYCRDGGDLRCQSNSTRRRINVTELRGCGEPASGGVDGCPLFTYPVKTSLEYNGTLGIIAFVLLTILTGVGIFALLCCRGYTPNPYISNAVTGVPDFRRPPREREVIQVRIVDPRRVGLLQGIPLKTVSMLELYRYQRARRTGTLDPTEENAVPGAEYMRERVERAEADAAAFANAGPIPPSSRARRAAAAATGGGGAGGGSDSGATSPVQPSPNPATTTTTRGGGGASPEEQEHHRRSQTRLSDPES